MDAQNNAKEAIIEMRIASDGSQWVIDNLPKVGAKWNSPKKVKKAKHGGWSHGDTLTPDPRHFAQVVNPAHNALQIAAPREV